MGGAFLRSQEYLEATFPPLHPFFPLMFARASNSRSAYIEISNIDSSAAITGPQPNRSELCQVMFVPDE